MDTFIKRLKEELHYNPETGVFTWKNTRGKRLKGSVAGNIYAKGYRVINVNGRNYQAARLAWVYTEGYMPVYTPRRINKIKSDDRRVNLYGPTKDSSMPIKELDLDFLSTPPPWQNQE